jgi:uncharacterized damage-inducible protein DinB
MISTEHVRLMARYNRWQNQSLYREADSLGEAARRQERGAFFSSIHGTLSHLMWGDGVWMHRFDGVDKPAGGIRDSVARHPDWSELKASRVRFDEVICTWAGRVSDTWLADHTGWYSGAMGRDVTRPNWLLVMHFFNHQTHHRGQVHAMITAAGGKPDDTDLIFMAAEVGS